jgi:hypothetical protein
MLLLILITLSVLVVAIGFATARLNLKVPCEHHWVESENGIKCSKCFRVIDNTPIHPADRLNENSFLDISDEEYSLADAKLD